MRNWTIVCAAVSALASTPVVACEVDPFLFLLPGETELTAQMRSNRISSDHRTVQQYEREKRDLEKAEAIYLARVEERTLGDFKSRIPPSTSIRPIHALKGSLPLGLRTLTDQDEGGMCSDVGDGPGARLEPGRCKSISLFQ